MIQFLSVYLTQNIWNYEVNENYLLANTPHKLESVSN